ncbi:MAG: type IV pilus assembly protein PilM [Candidatus Hydrogenedentes bacterium]|nr:type IV pilus assembly protein PilM [Candidatus Hydrogenedentota bacterium]
MAKLKRGKSSKKLVLDLGSSAVRLCELTPTKTGYQLTKYYHREFPIDPSMEEDAQRDARKATIQALLKDAKVRAKKTIFGVPGQSVFTRTRTLPPVPEYKVTQIVRYEIQQQIPFQLDQIAYDYQVLQRTEAGGYDVLMAAIKVDVIEKRLDTIKDIKKQVDTVDVCPLAAYNWLKFTKEFGETGECVALIDLGASTTDIVIERDNQFRFTRSLNLGGNDVTSAIAADFGMQWAQAEKLKREKGFAPTGDAARDGKGGEVIGRVLNRLVSEINRSFAYFRSQPGGGPVNRIIVTGGGACLRNMIPFLQRQLGIEVRIAQPLAGLAIAPGAQEVNEHPEQAAVALGLALRCCEAVTIGINLIPPRILEAARRREAGLYWLLSGTTFVLIMLTIVPAMAQQNKLIEDEIVVAKRQISTFDPSLPFQKGSPTQWKSQHETQIASLMAEVTGYIDKVKVLDDQLKNRRQWINDLVAINGARPRGKLLLIHRMETTQVVPPGAQGPAAAPAPAERSERKGLSGLASLGAANRISLGAGPAMGTTVTDTSDPWQSSGFEGITPRMGGMATAGGDPIAAMMNAPAPMMYNGIMIAGYAQDVASIEEFRQNLEASGRFMVDGKPAVYFDERFTDPKPFTELDNASGGTQGMGAPRAGLGGGSGGGSGGRRTRYDEEEDESSGMSFDQLSGRNSAGPNAPQNMQWDQYGSVVSFRIDVQFRPASELPAQAAAPTMARGSGRGGRDSTRYDEE